LNTLRIKQEWTRRKSKARHQADSATVDLQSANAGIGPVMRIDSNGSRADRPTARRGPRGEEAELKSKDSVQGNVVNFGFDRANPRGRWSASVFRLGAAANELVALRFSHSEEVGKDVKMDCDRNCLQLRRHAHHETCDFECIWLGLIYRFHKRRSSMEPAAARTRLSSERNPRATQKNQCICRERRPLFKCDHIAEKMRCSNEAYSYGLPSFTFAE
jgi:hypothetical protein